MGRDRPRGVEPVEWLGADGTAIVNADDPVTRAYADGTDAALITFGLDPGADVGPRTSSSARCASDVHPVVGRRARAGALAVPGDHMVSNASPPRRSGAGPA